MPHTLPPALPPKHGPPFPPLDTQVSNVSSSCHAALAASSRCLCPHHPSPPVPALPPLPPPPRRAQVSNVSSSCRAALAASSASLAEKTSSLQTRLDDTLSTFDSIMEGTAELQVEVTDEVIRGLCLLTLLF